MAWWTVRMSRDPLTVEHELRPAGQEDLPFFGPFDALAAARRDHVAGARDARVGDRRDRRGARARAGRFGGADAAFPDQDVHRPLVHDLNELDVDLLRELRMVLQQWTEAVQRFLGQGLIEQDALRVAHVE